MLVKSQVSWVFVGEIPIFHGFLLATLVTPDSPRLVARLASKKGNETRFATKIEAKAEVGSGSTELGNAKTWKFEGYQVYPLVTWDLMRFNWDEKWGFNGIIIHLMEYTLW